MATLRLGQLAIARSGDKGGGANIGVIALTPASFEFLREALSARRVQTFFAPLEPGEVVRYELPNLRAFNFILPAVLDGGGSVSLRIDAQGKTLGQAILEMPIEVAEDRLPDLVTAR